MRAIAPLLFGCLLAMIAGCHTAETSPVQASTAEPPSAETADAKADTNARPIAVDPAGRTEMNRWCVTGTVHDQHGKPLADVGISASCGIGSLMPTGDTSTDEHGHYTLWFGPGMRSPGGEFPGLQAATISPYKTGWYERHLHRQGDLRMANQPPSKDERARWGSEKAVVLPDQPYRLDFVMTPAAKLSGRLLDREGKPIVNHMIMVDREPLPPSCSVLANIHTDKDGRFQHTQLPEGEFWLAFSAPNGSRQEVRTPMLQAVASKPVSIELVYDPTRTPPVSVRLMPTR